MDVLPLDSFGLGGEKIFLKVDTQGADADVLRGSIKTLHAVQVLYLEMPFLQAYEGGATVAELFSLTQAAGLYPARFFANSITHYGAWVDGDVIFVRNPSRDERS